MADRVIWEVADRLGIVVRLTASGLAHVRERHRETGEAPDAIAAAVAQAGHVRRDATRPDRRCHYLPLQPGERPKMLKVVVEYRLDASGREIGEVVTAYPTHRFKTEESTLWP